MLYVDGKWVDSDKRSNVNSPVTGKQIGSVPLADEGLVKAAIDSAESAKEKWRSTTRVDRAKLLLELGKQLHVIIDDVSQTITMEMGKPLLSARTEIESSANFITQTAEQIKRLETTYLPCEDADVISFTKLEPYGVFAIISPWNYPVFTSIAMLAPALAAGNTVVFKPAEQTPLSGQKLVECFDKARFPPGVVNLVQGPGEITGEAITSSKKIDGIGFTGSIETGRRIASRQADKLTHFVFELGGNGPSLVLDDADLPAAASWVAESCYVNSGQDCQSGERILVQEKIIDEFTKQMIEKTRPWQLGDPMRPETKMGPLVEEAIASKVDRHISDAVGKGAKALTGGNRANGYPTNLYYQSTVLSGVTPDMVIANEETFGPVCPLIKCGSIDEAIELANSGDYGLACSVYTRDAKKAMMLSDKIKTGTVTINYPSTFTDPGVPFGGMRKSGLGRIMGKYGIMSMSQLKSVFWNLG